MQLTITKQEWIKTEDNPLGVSFPENVDWKTSTKLRFKKYTEVAEFLDSTPDLKNKVMLLKVGQSAFGKKVIFDGVDTFIEGRGHV